MSPHFTTAEEVDAPHTNGDAPSVPLPQATAEAPAAAEAQESQVETSAAPSNEGELPSAAVEQNGHANGHTNGHINGNGSIPHSPSQRTPKSPYLVAADPEVEYDLVCAGFGPASLAIAVALHDALEAGTLKQAPRVLFLEKQAKFAWHAGMLLPGAKMQISFIKDLASLRNPRSNFTFLNYLHSNDRLVEFTNLSTFLPARVEYEDYLRWCASHFSDVVKYQNAVVSVRPLQAEGPQKTFEVTSRHTKTGTTSTYRARNVLLAVGGQASIPQFLPAQNPRVVHSSQYAQVIPSLLTDRSAPYRVAVIGAGQSAAEIFNNIQTLYPNSRTYLVMRSEFLKPSDDSPFVNSIFNPAFIDSLYPKSSAYRRALLDDARPTNYGVVRLELIEHLYERMYDQRREIGPDEKQWPHRILGGRRVVDVEEAGDKLRVRVCLSPPGEELQDGPLLEEEVIEADIVIAATGYKRSAHIDMLKETWPLLPAMQESEQIHAGGKDRWFVETEAAANVEASPEKTRRVLEVGRNYGVRFAPGTVAPGSGVWLQGCCEGTHGLSDTLLSVLGTRSGEIVESIFGSGTAGQ